MPESSAFAFAGDVATAIAAYGLSTIEAPPPIDDDVWPLVLARIGDEKLVGIATAAADDGWLKLADEQYDALVERERDAMTWCLDLERRLLVLADAFAARRIPFVVLKGPALAHGVYPDPSWRPFGDLDLLVETARWRDACAALAAFGWPRRLPEPRRGFDERFGKSAVFTTETHQQIDLHRTLAQGPFGIWIDADELFTRRDRFILGGRTLDSLDATARFVHACVHAVLGDERPALMQVRDIVETSHVDLDIDAVRRLAMRWRLGPVIERAATLAAAIDGGEIVGRLGSPPSRPLERRALEAYAPRARAIGRLELATIRAIPNIIAKARYVRDLVAPERAFSDARGGARRWATPLRWFARRGADY